MISRRDFFSLLALPLLSTAKANNPQKSDIQSDESFKGRAVFDRLIKKSLANDWEKLPIGTCMGHIALELLGTPYVGHTLELSKNRELCAVNFMGLDCVTLFENVLDFSRMLILGGRTPQAMLKQIQFTRYRHGVMNGYLSRLHYTSDWFHDNVIKGVVEDLSAKLPDHENFIPKVGIMSSHPQASIQLASHPEWISTMEHYEDRINSRKMHFIPMEKVAGIEHLLQTGDIIGVTTEIPGLDIIHTGLIHKSEDGIAHFLDASSSPSRMKVTLEGSLHTAIRWSHLNSGIMVARPLDPLRSTRTVHRS